MMKDKILVFIWENWKKLALWTCWILVLFFLGFYFGGKLFNASDKHIFLSGQMTSGHYQIEIKCDVCHTPFQGVKQEACLNCHETELKQANDSHQIKKFNDPRNEPLLTTIDAKSCITCHDEHGKQNSSPMGVTQPNDFCAYCHQDIAKDRPSHQDFKFDGCRDCHNYHDNRALYEDFLAKHLHEEETFSPEKAVLPVRNFSAIYQADHPAAPLTLSQHNAPDPAKLEKAQDWEHSSHANAGVNCQDCHVKNNQAWIDKPDQSYCEKCHSDETKGFLASRHGMRIAQNLPPMITDLARREMRTDETKAVSCQSCHSAHRFNTEPTQTAVESCLGCHQDEHSRAYKASPHFLLWSQAQKGNLPANAGVSCATCHLPRETVRRKGKELVKIQHNVNHNLRPNSKMIRDVCTRCHGLGMVLDALADKEQIRYNFAEHPKKHLQSLEMIEQRSK